MNPRSSRYGIYVVGLLAAATFVSNLDAAVLPAVAQAIKAEFGISDTQIGALISAYTIALALTTIPIGYLADRRARRTIIGVGMAVWSLATLVTGLTRSFAQIFAARAALGVGEAVVVPISTSLIGDQFAASTRGRAMGTVFAALGLGQAVGVIAGGAIALHFGWRWAFYMAGIPGLLLVPLFLTMREPLRGAAERRGPQVIAAGDAQLASVVRLLRIRTFAVTVGAAALTAFGLGVIQFIPLYLGRQFGLNTAQAAALLGIPLLLAGVGGLPVIGWLVDWRGRRSTRAPIEVAVAGLAIGAVAAAVMFSVRVLPVFEAGLIVFALTAGTAVVARPVVLQSVVVPSLRASAAAMQNTLATLFGFASGPLAVGVVSDLTGGDLGLSLRLLAPVAFAAATIGFALALRSISRDTQAMEESWAQRDVEAPLPSPAGSRISVGQRR